ncbi:MAG: hypothetical protein JSS97_19725, partial [Actinobacteria bacterium]|nr:hypothetical protein [Actinomycetota bacterium]
MVLDEPDGRSGPGGLLGLRLMIRAMVEEEGRTVFISSHLLDEIEKTHDGAVIIDDGLPDGRLIGACDSSAARGDFGGTRRIAVDLFQGRPIRCEQLEAPVARIEDRRVAVGDLCRVEGSMPREEIAEERPADVVVGLAFDRFEEGALRGGVGVEAGE